MFQRFLALIVAATAFAAFARAADSADVAVAGRVSGRVVDAATRQPVEYVAIVLKNAAGQSLQRAATDAKGEFVFEHVSAGEYRVTYAPLGGDAQESPIARSEAAKPDIDFGVLLLAGAAVKMAQMEVSAGRDAAQHAIDRKSYVVGQDLKGASGSASDLLQSVPSVQVDIEGNVSLRGDSGVLILIDGKPSAFVAAGNRANALAQMPAESIERIEVITNPSARYRPDGTAGIINLVLKRERKPGLGGLVRVSMGTGNRATMVLSFNYRPRDYALFGAVMARRDGRDGTTELQRSHLDPATNSLVQTEMHGADEFRFHTRVLRPGFEYRPTEKDQLSGSLYAFDRSTARSAATVYRAQRATAALDEDYDRVRHGDERQKSWEATLNYTHTYAKEGPELSVVARGERMHGNETDAYTNTYRLPLPRVSRDTLLTRPLETEAELSVDYTRPLPHEGKLEAGYEFEGHTLDRDLRRLIFDATGNWAPDPARSNRFRFRQLLQSAYATFGRPVGKFGFLAGLRLEEARQHTDQATIGRVDDVTYHQVHPTLHLSYQLSEPWKLQLSYSHRVNRPDGEQLNPFPDYQDPYNLGAGNPRLRPEETHSVESGVEYRKGETTYLAAIYWRETYRAFTPVTRAIDAVTLLTTEENLGRRGAGGLELVATTKLGPTLSLNASANAFRSEIDASNLGFSARRVAMTWDAKINLKWRPRKADAVQLDTNYAARRLTAQGHREPTFNTNLAWRHDFQERKYAVTVSLLDVFATAREHTIIDTPALREDSVRRRNARVLYVGFVYNFGQPPKKAKDENLIEPAP